MRVIRVIRLIGALRVIRVIGVIGVMRYIHAYIHTWLLVEGGFGSL